MADNYLEHQYEEYQAKRAAWLQNQKLGKTKKNRAYQTLKRENYEV